jgi:hypothetical protein
MSVQPAGATIVAPAPRRTSTAATMVSPASTLGVLITSEDEADDVVAKERVRRTADAPSAGEEEEIAVPAKKASAAAAIHHRRNLWLTRLRLSRGSR